MQFTFLAVIPLFLLEIIPFIHSKDVDKCSICKDLVSSFEHGLSKTEKSNFGGGNTEWEEKSLQKYRRSEIRYHEVTDFVCKSYGDVKIDKDAEHRCFDFFNKNEEDLETWYFHKQSQSRDLKTWFCINTTKACCPNNTWGPECEPCLGQQDRPCFGRGKCDGAGTREGTGKCKCNIGYQGNLCRKCSTNYFSSFQNDTDITCERCNRACKSGCSGPLPKDCLNCKDGWTFAENEGCTDVNECNNNPCTDQNEMCLNKEGGFECKCKENYRKENGVCVLDVADKENEDDDNDDKNEWDNFDNESFFEKEEGNMSDSINKSKEQVLEEAAGASTTTTIPSSENADKPKETESVKSDEDEFQTVPSEKEISNDTEQKPTKESIQSDKKPEIESLRQQQGAAQINDDAKKSKSPRAEPPLDDKTIRERRKQVQDHLKQLMDTLQSLDKGKGSTGNDRMKNKFKYSDPKVQSIMEKLDQTKQQQFQSDGINPSDIYKKAGIHKIEL